MSRIISTAGRVERTATDKAKRETIAKIRAKLRSQNDQDVDDAIEALVEMARTPEE